jgi:hypothetical protein
MRRQSRQLWLWGESELLHSGTVTPLPNGLLQLLGRLRVLADAGLHCWRAGPPFKRHPYFLCIRRLPGDEGGGLLATSAGLRPSERQRTAGTGLSRSGPERAPRRFVPPLSRGLLHGYVRVSGCPRLCGRL